MFLNQGRLRNTPLCWKSMLTTYSDHMLHASRSLNNVIPVAATPANSLTVNGFLTYILSPLLPVCQVKLSNWCCNLLQNVSLSLSLQVHACIYAIDDNNVVLECFVTHAIYQHSLFKLRMYSKCAERRVHNHCGPIIS